MPCQGCNNNANGLVQIHTTFACKHSGCYAMCLGTVCLGTRACVCIARTVCVVLLIWHHVCYACCARICTLVCVFWCMCHVGACRTNSWWWTVRCCAWRLAKKATCSQRAVSRAKCKCALMLRTEYSSPNCHQSINFDIPAESVDCLWITLCVHSFTACWVFEIMYTCDSLHLQSFGPDSFSVFLSLRITNYEKENTSGTYFPFPLLRFSLSLKSSCPSPHQTLIRSSKINKSKNTHGTTCMCV